LYVKPEGHTDHLEDLGVDGRVSFKSVLKKQAWDGVYTIYVAR
jgi:hypothetical protein